MDDDRLGRQLDEQSVARLTFAQGGLHGRALAHLRVQVLDGHVQLGGAVGNALLELAVESMDLGVRAFAGGDLIDQARLHRGEGVGEAGDLGHAAGLGGQRDAELVLVELLGAGGEAFERRGQAGGDQGANRGGDGDPEDQGQEHHILDAPRVAEQEDLLIARAVEGGGQEQRRRGAGAERQGQAYLQRTRVDAIEPAPNEGQDAEDSGETAVIGDARPDVSAERAAGDQVAEQRGDGRRRGQSDPARVGLAPELVDDQDAAAKDEEAGFERPGRTGRIEGRRGDAQLREHHEHAVEQEAGADDQWQQVVFAPGGLAADERGQAGAQREQAVVDQAEPAWGPRKAEGEQAEGERRVQVEQDFGATATANGGHADQAGADQHEGAAPQLEIGLQDGVGDGAELVRRHQREHADERAQHAHGPLQRLDANGGHPRGCADLAEQVELSNHRARQLAAVDGVGAVRNGRLERVDAVLAHVGGAGHGLLRNGHGARRLGQVDCVGLAGRGRGGRVGASAAQRRGRHRGAQAIVGVDLRDRHEW